jgi:tetratricopeptide (TPR) repeat protein
MVCRSVFRWTIAVVATLAAGSAVLAADAQTGKPQTPSADRPKDSPAVGGSASSGGASADVPGKSPAGSPADSRQIDALIRQLGAADYAARQNAQDRLASFGFAAFDALTTAANHDDFEIASRARYLLRVLRAQWYTDADRPIVRQILQNYEMQTTTARAVVILRLARLGDLAGVPALCRLIRFERSLPLSNLAAVAIMNEEPFDAPSKQRLAGILRTRLAGCNRTGVKWLMTYLRMAESPKTVLPEFEKYAQTEMAFVRATPDGVPASVTVYLQYHVARTYAALGDKEKAGEWARRAREFARSNDEARLNLHSRAAMALRRFGLFDWAEQECIQLTLSGHPVAAFTGWGELAEMRFEQGRNLEAAEARKRSTEAIKNLNMVAVEWESRRRTSVARMNYFYACHDRDQKDLRKEREHIEAAIAADPEEVDSLIAAFRLRDSKPAFRAKIAQMIEQRATTLRHEIADAPDDAEGYNQFAWLVGNTQGDLDEALNYSKKSLEISPGLGSYLDTLAHVYFTKGDLENAVAYQTQAVEKDPHSWLIARELKTFQAALEAKKKETKKQEPKSQ